MSAARLTVTHTDGHARTGTLELAHATVELPTFMPVGTQGSVKALSAAEVASTGAQIVLGNTYHLWLRPGEERVRAMGGLRGFMKWPHATLTDSGGFQIFSLGPKVDDEGATFRSTYDGSRHHLSPEGAAQVQSRIGADIQMVLDVCPPLPSPERHRWRRPG